MKPERQLTVAVAQHACSDDAQANWSESEAAVREAAQAGAELVLLQELHSSLYFPVVESPELHDLAEPIPGPGSDRLAALAEELDIVIVGSLFERRAAGISHNTAVVCDRDRGLVGRYRKMHIPDDPGYYEKFYFTPGDHGPQDGFVPIDTSVGRLGVWVCWDQWFPEAARLMALSGAELLLYPTAIGWDPNDDDDEQDRQQDAWLTVQRAHAVANGLPVLAANRVGFEDDPSGQTAGAEFWGNSFIAGPQGELLAEAGEERSVLVETLDLNRCEQVRRLWPYLRDRRIDAYGGLLQRIID